MTPSSATPNSKPAAETVLIIGGGMGGLSAAISLAKHGVQVTVVEEKHEWIGASIAYYHRAIYALDEMGIVEDVMAQGTVTPAEAPSWWTGIYNAQGEKLGFAGPQLPDGWTLPSAITIYRPRLAKIMTARAQELGVEVLTGVTYTSIEAHEDRVDVELTTGERRSADLLVGADGINSGVRKRFFPEAGEPNYIGSMAFRIMFEDAPDWWRTGLHVGGGTTISTAMLADNLFYLAVPKPMEKRPVDQDEAREIVHSVLAPYRPSEMWDSVDERVTGETQVVVNPYEWIFITPPWHRGRVVLLGDAVHATAPTMGSAGGLAIEDGVVLGLEVGATGDLETALNAYSNRRAERSKGVVDASVWLMRSHQEKRPAAEEAEVRLAALQKTIEPY